MSSPPIHILCLETSTTVCSVCVTDNSKILSFRETNNGYTHAENLHVFIDEIIKEAGLEFNQLNAIAVGKGPGSYTGLRIGVSAAKGLCYALNIPLISINILQSMAYKVAKETNKDMLYCPMLDARRMEVYCAVYGRDLKEIIPTRALVLDDNSLELFNLNKPILFFGNGMNKARELLQKHIPQASFLEEIIPSSFNLADLALEKFHNQQFENLALFEPFYLKEFFMKKD